MHITAWRSQSQNERASTENLYNLRECIESTEECHHLASFLVYIYTSTRVRSSGVFLHIDCVPMLVKRGGIDCLIQNCFSNDAQVVVNGCLSMKRCEVNFPDDLILTLTPNLYLSFSFRLRKSHTARLYIIIYYYIIIADSWLQKSKEIKKKRWKIGIYMYIYGDLSHYCYSSSSKILADSNSIYEYMLWSNAIMYSKLDILVRDGHQ